MAFFYICYLYFFFPCCTVSALNHDPFNCNKYQTMNFVYLYTPIKYKIIRINKNIIMF